MRREILNAKYTEYELIFKTFSDPDRFRTADMLFCGSCFPLTLLPEVRSVLDLGCGTGRDMCIASKSESETRTAAGAERQYLRLFTFLRP